jgi:hypothetical protein
MAMRRWISRLLLAVGLVPALATQSPAGTVPVELTITRVDGASGQLESNEINGLVRGDPEWYAAVYIDGVFHHFRDLRQDDTPDVEPNWTFAVNVADVRAKVPVVIEIWEADECCIVCDPAPPGSCTPSDGFDDVADVSPDPGTPFLQFSFFLGELSLPRSEGTTADRCPAGSSLSTSGTDCCSTGDTPGESVQVCWRVQAPAIPDSDGDGLLDPWEAQGIDNDGDGTIDLDLAQLGADPQHKDIFLELDWMTGEEPRKGAVTPMKAAFAAAPIDAGGVANPDGLPGITLHVDAGSLVDPASREDNGPSGSCTDGIDNGGDGKADAADPDCLVGDDFGAFGEGNAMPASSICGLDPSFYAAKSANFDDASRHSAFRYAISGRGCGDSGGQGEIGGNDFIEFNHDGGTVMHELGHTLNLRHGGFENVNCKPNYVSVMNYDLQFGIQQRILGPFGFTTILDYSPPRFPGGRGMAPLPALTESMLSEQLILDATDQTNTLVFVDANGQKRRGNLDAGIDWDANGLDAQSHVVNINTVGTNGQPISCLNNASDQTLAGYDDWSNVELAFLKFGDSASGALNPTLEPEPMLADLERLQNELNTRALNVTFVRIKRSKTGPRPNGTISIKGDLLTAPAEGDLLTAAGGATVRVKAGLGLDESFSFAAHDCRRSTSGVVQCRTAGNGARARFRPFRASPDQFRFTLSARGLAIAPPIQGPVEVTLTYPPSPAIRQGENSACAATESAGLFCKLP